MSEENPTIEGKVGYKNPPVETRFGGVRGNPASHGRAKGTRLRLQGDFVKRLADDFDRYGKYAIARCRHNDPTGYVRVCASLMPKEVEVSPLPLDEISDEQLNAAIVAVRAILAAQDAGSSTTAALITQSAEVVSPVS
jgi:hypothetical protein